MYVLAIDIGTSSCKAGLYSSKGLLTLATRRLTIISKYSGCAELDPNAVWLTVKEAVAEVLAGGKGNDVAAISFSSLGEAFVPVNKNGMVAGPSILSFDSRGAEYIDTVRNLISEKDFFAINHNIMGPHLSLAKMLWLREHQPEAFDAADSFLLWADFLGYKFGAAPYTTASLANRTMLFDVGKSAWSDSLMTLFDMDPEKMAPIVAGGEIVGTVSPAVADELGLRREALLVAGGHDQCCNALGCGCIRPGDVVVGMGTYETYCPVFQWPGDTELFRREGMNIEHHVVDGLYASFLHNYSGLLVEWFCRTFSRPEAVSHDIFEVLNHEIPNGPGSLLFLPYNEPPQWPRYLEQASGAFVGLKSDSSRGEMFLAVLEGITYFFVDVIEAMARMGIIPTELKASGGGSRSDTWMQIRADIIGIPFTRMATTEGSLTGAALLAAVAAGLFSNLQEGCECFVTRQKTFHPDQNRHRQYVGRVALYREMYPALGAIMANLSALPTT